MKMLKNKIKLRNIYKNQTYRNKKNMKLNNINWEHKNHSNNNN